DLGPLGTVVADSPLPLNLGVRITVHEIPADLSAVDAASFDALAGDLDGYLSSSTHPSRRCARPRGPSPGTPCAALRGPRWCSPPCCSRCARCSGRGGAPSSRA